MDDTSDRESDQGVDGAAAAAAAAAGSSEEAPNGAPTEPVADETGPVQVCERDFRSACN